MVIGPFLFLFLKSATNNTKLKWALHFVPYLVAITIVGIVYPICNTEKFGVDGL